MGFPRPEGADRSGIGGFSAPGGRRSGSTYANSQNWSDFREQTVIYTFLDSTRPTESFKVKFELCHPATIKSLVFEAIFLNFFGLKKAFF